MGCFTLDCYFSRGHDKNSKGMAWVIFWRVGGRVPGRARSGGGGRGDLRGLNPSLNFLSDNPLSKEGVSLSNSLICT